MSADQSLVITPAHLLYTMVAMFVSFGIPMLVFLWRISNATSRLMMKMDMVWQWYCKEHGINGKSGD